MVASGGLTREQEGNRKPEDCLRFLVPYPQKSLTSSLASVIRQSSWGINWHLLRAEISGLGAFVSFL